MKVLLLNGSPHAKGNTAASLEEMIPIFQEAGIETELIQVGHLPIRGCCGCQSCYRTGKCAIDDVVNELAVKLQEADGLVVGSPVYYSNIMKQTANISFIFIKPRSSPNFFCTMSHKPTMISPRPRI